MGPVTIEEKAKIETTLKLAAGTTGGSERMAQRVPDHYNP